MPSTRRTSRWRGWAIGGLALVAFGVLGAPAAADGGHLPGFSVAAKRVAIAKLPELLRFSFGDIPGVKGSPFFHVGHGPVWFGEVARPRATIYVAGNRRWVCVTEVKTEESAGGASCTPPAPAREIGLLEVRACSKGPPRHFRVVVLVPDGVTAVTLEKRGRASGRTLPVIDNTLAFTVGREDIVLHGSGSAAAEDFERGLPLAGAAKLFGGDQGGGCSAYTFAETRKPAAPERPF